MLIFIHVKCKICIFNWSVLDAAYICYQIWCPSPCAPLILKSMILSRRDSHASTDRRVRRHTILYGPNYTVKMKCAEHTHFGVQIVPSTCTCSTPFDMYMYLEHHLVCTSHKKMRWILSKFCQWSGVLGTLHWYSVLYSIPFLNSTEAIAIKGF